MIFQSYVSLPEGSALSSRIGFCWVVASWNLTWNLVNMSCLMSKQNLPAAFFWRYGLLDISSKFYIMEAVQRRLLTQKTWGWQHWDVPAPKLTLNPRPFKRKSSLIFLPGPQNVPSKLRSAAWFFHPQPWRRTTTIDVSGGCSFGTIGQWPIQHFFQVDDSGTHRDWNDGTFIPRIFPSLSLFLMGVLIPMDQTWSMLAKFPLNLQICIYSSRRTLKEVPSMAG